MVLQAVARRTVERVRVRGHPQLRWDRQRVHHRRKRVHDGQRPRRRQERRHLGHRRDGRGGLRENAPDDPKPQAAPGGGLDVFVERRGADGSRYYGYLLGGGGNDQGNAIVLDRLGDIYIGGTSTGGYSVKNAVQPTKKDADTTADGILTKLGCYIHPFLPVPQQPAAGGSDKVSYLRRRGLHRGSRQRHSMGPRHGTRRALRLLHGGREPNGGDALGKYHALGQRHDLHFSGRGQRRWGRFGVD